MLRSLRLRLFAAAAVSIAFALFLTGLAIVQLFERQVRDQVRSDIDNHLLQLAGTVEIAADGTVTAGQALADPRFSEPYGGRYWRIDFEVLPGQPPREPVRSPSLWDSDVDLVAGTGPDGEAVIFSSRKISIDNAGKPLGLVLIMAVHEDEVLHPLGQLRDQLTVALTLIGVVLSVGAWLQVSIGLRPLKTLRQQLSTVRSGASDQLPGPFPAEVAPLAGELNSLLDMQAKSLERARRRAGDLAHGLKTPLTVLSAITRDIRKHGLSTQADDVDEQAEAMRRHVERALARARLSTGRGHGLVPLYPAAEKVIATLRRLPKGDEIAWTLNAATDSTIPLDPGDLTELLGNLLDNARKWAKSRISLAYTGSFLSIEDDGPGVTDAELGQISARGQKLDETKQGSGLGLSIVEDIADTYGLKIAYSRSALGGLKVEIRI